MSGHPKIGNSDSGKTSQNTDIDNSEIPTRRITRRASALIDEAERAGAKGNSDSTLPTVSAVTPVVPNAQSTMGNEDTGLEALSTIEKVDSEGSTIVKGGRRYKATSKLNQKAKGAYEVRPPTLPPKPVTQSSIGGHEVIPPQVPDKAVVALIPKKVELMLRVSTFANMHTAVNAGVKRFILHADGEDGWWTPSFGFVAMITRCFPRAEIWVSIQPSGKKYHYDDYDWKIIKADISAFVTKLKKVKGFVVGVLNEKNEIDEEAYQGMSQCVYPKKLMFSTAIDLVSNPISSLNTLSAMGFSMALSGGRKDTILEGVEDIKQLVAAVARKKISVTVSGDITPDNVVDIIRKTGTCSILISNVAHIGPLNEKLKVYYDSLSTDNQEQGQVEEDVQGDEVVEPPAKKQKRASKSKKNK